MTRARINDAMLAKIMADARATRSMYQQAEDDAPSRADGWWILLGAAAALGWVAGLAWFGIVG